MPKSPTFNIIHHHLFQVAAISSFGVGMVSSELLGGQLLKLEGLVDSPLFAWGIASAMAKSSVNTHLRQVRSGIPGNIPHAADYVGFNGEYQDEYFLAEREFLLRLFLLPDETLVRVSYDPDEICRTCQINGSGNIGNHCAQQLDIKQNPYVSKDA